MVRWRAQDQEWRGVNRGGNEMRNEVRKQKGKGETETMAFVGFKILGGPCISCIISVLGTGKSCISGI